MQNTKLIRHEQRTSMNKLWDTISIISCFSNYHRTPMVHSPLVRHKSHTGVCRTVPSWPLSLGKLVQMISDIVICILTQARLCSLGSRLCFCLKPMPSTAQASYTMTWTHVIPGIDSPSSALSAVLFDFAFARQVINKYGRRLLRRDCVDLDNELVSTGAPAEVVGAWRNTRTTKSPPERKSMIPYTWGIRARDRIIIVR